MNKEVAVITGGSSGIGLEICAALLSKGLYVINLDLNKPIEMPDCDASYKYLNCDVTSMESISTAIIELEGSGISTVDLVVNNAGISVRATFSEHTEAVWQKVMATNLTGPFNVSKVMLPLMKMSKNPQIINVSSVSGLVGMPNYLAYNVSKAGLIEMTKTLAVELAPAIRVNAICPGYVLTEMQRNEYSLAELVDQAKRIPVKRQCTPKEIASLVVYLSSADASYFNGSILVVDGGETAGGMAS